MPRWGDGTIWGGGAKWGAATLPEIRRLSWGVVVDWDNNGSFDGYNEMPYVLDMNIRRGREFFMTSNGSGFESRFAGNIRITLKNLDGRYDPFNINGPLYGLLESNQRIKIFVRDEATGTIYNVFFGRIDDIRPNYSEVPTVTLTASDGIKYLESTQVKSSAVAVGQRYTTSIAAILTAAAWKDGISIDNTLSDTMPFWWMDGTGAYGQIVDLANALLGQFYIAADGTAVFIPRNYNDASVVNFEDHDALYSWKIRTPSPRYTIKNVATVYARKRTAQPNVALWQLTDIPSVAAGATITIWANYSYNNVEVPASVVTTPVATTDYTMNTASNGSGTNLTASFSVTITKFATAAKLVIKNNSASTGYITLLKVRGTAITADEYTFVQNTNDASIAIHGEREFVVQLNWLQDINVAADMASLLTTLLPSPRRYPQFLVRGQPAKQFALDLTNLATIGFNTINFSDIMRVGYIEHNVTAETAGNICDTIFYFEPNLGGATSGTWIFPAIFGSSTVF